MCSLEYDDTTWQLPKKITTSTHSRNNLSVLGSGYAKMSLHSVAEDCTPSVSGTLIEGLKKEESGMIIVVTS